MAYREPPWSEDTMSRKKGDTTFKTCGWCKHTSSGTFRYECALSTQCGLLPSYYPYANVEWDTPCRVMQLGRKSIQFLISRKVRAIEDGTRQIARLAQDVATLSAIKAEDTPPLPWERAHDHFNVDDKIACWTDNEWTFYTVVYGYRHHDGCVSFRDEAGRERGCGVSIPHVMKMEEFNFFIGNPAAFRTWLELSNREYNGERIDVEAMWRGCCGTVSEQCG